MATPYRYSTSLFLLDSLGAAIRALPSQTSYEYAQGVMRTGRAVFRFPLGVFDPKLLTIERRIEIWQQSPVSGDELDSATQWIIRRTNRTRDSMGREIIAAYCTDLNGLLDRRVVAYDPETAQTLKTAPADDMLKAIVAENYSASATDANRQINSAYFAVAPNTSSAPSISKGGFSRVRVSKILREIADDSYNAGTYLAYRMVRTTSALCTFTTYVGQMGANKTLTIVGGEYGNAGEAENGVDWDNERNFVYAIGDPGAVTVPVATAGNTRRLLYGPYARTEEVIQGRDRGGDLTYLQSEARSAVIAMRPRINQRVKVVETKNFRRGVHFSLGDIITVDDLGAVYPARIDTWSVSRDPSGKQTTTLELRSVDDSA